MSTRSQTPVLTWSQYRCFIRRQTPSCAKPQEASKKKNGNKTYYGSPSRHHTRSQAPIITGSQTPVCARIRTPGTDDRSQTKIKRIVAVSQGITTAHRGNGSTFGSETPIPTGSQTPECHKTLVMKCWKRV